MQLVSLAYLSRKQFWVLLYHLVKMRAEKLVIPDKLFIQFPLNRQGNPLTRSCDIHFGFGTLSLGHIDASLAKVCSQYCPNLSLTTKSIRIRNGHRKRCLKSRYGVLNSML